MMARVFEIDVYLCPKCGSQMQQIAFITDPRAIRDVLHALKMPTAATCPREGAATTAVRLRI